MERARPELRRLLRRHATSRRRRKAWPRRSSPAACLRSSGTPTTSTARPTSATRAKNDAYYERYPEDRDRVREIVERLETEDVRLPTGDRLTGRRFRQLGHMLGMSYGAETAPLHRRAAVRLARVPARRARRRSRFARNPLYAVIHEACYASGRGDALVGRARLPRGRCGTTRPSSPASTSTRGCSRSTARSSRWPRRRRSWPSTSGRRSTTSSGWPRTRFRPRPRSTPRTCTSSASSRRRPPRASAACAPG